MRGARMFRRAVVVDKKNYFLVKQALSEEVCELLADYAQMKRKVKPNVIRRGDPLAGVHREYGDLMMETLLDKLTPLVEHVTGCALWPTLSFYYTYQQGQQLTPHTDRSSCQFVAGLCIGVDAAYKERHQGWPLFLRLNDQTVESVVLACGDLIIFRGHDILHWREVFTGTWFVSAIFGFVEKQGPFAFQKYDQRRSLGMPHVGMFHW